MNLLAKTQEEAVVFGFHWQRATLMKAEMRIILLVQRDGAFEVRREEFGALDDGIPGFADAIGVI